MRILFIKQLFDPEPTAKSLDFAEELTRRGHKVEVLTGFPSYPLGKIYKGYKQSLWKKETINNVRIIRIPIYPSHDDNGLKRSLHYISYAISASILGPFLVKKPQVLFVYQGAIPVGIPAIIIKWLFKAPYLYDINDLWPDTVKASGMLNNKLLLKFINKWTQLNYKQASAISVLSEGFKQTLINRGIPANKITVVSNWSRDKYANDKINNASDIFPKNKLNILYAGNLGVVQKLETLLKTAKLLTDEGDDYIRFVFLGAGADENYLKKRAHELNLKNVSFLPRVAKEEVMKYLNSADILIVHLKKDDLYKITIPSKILSYLQVGKPILMGLEGNASELIINSGGGWLFEPENHVALKNRIDSIKILGRKELEAYGSKGRNFYKTNLSLKTSTDKLEFLFHKIANNDEK